MSRWTGSDEKWVLLAVAALGIGGIALVMWMAMHVATRAPDPNAKLQHLDDPANGTRCYWMYTGESGGIAMSCVALEKDAGPR